MKRIVVVGEGYRASKVAALAARKYPKADLLWVSDTSMDKYPWELLSLLVRSKTLPDEWSKLRAALKVDFENHQKSIGLIPKKVKRVRIDPAEREISFLSTIGHMSYVIDKALVLIPWTVRSKMPVPDNAHIWPSDSCIDYLVHNWESLTDPVVFSQDLSLVQVLVRGGKKFCWIRSEDVLSPQMQFFLDQRLNGIGIKTVKAKSPDHWQEALETSGYSYRDKQIFLPGEYDCDTTKLAAYGLNAESSNLQNPSIIQCNPASVALNPLYGQDDIHFGEGPESAVSQTLKMAEAALRDESFSCSFERTKFWNMGDLSVATSNAGTQELRTEKQKTEFALACDRDNISKNAKHALNLVINKDSKLILGLEAIGPEASKLAGHASCLISCQASLEKMQEVQLPWDDLGVNPLFRCARILENKLSPGIFGITPDELKESADNGVEFFLLDVRGSEQFSLNRIPGATNIPVEQLSKRMMEIPRFTPLVLYSQTSAKAYSAARLLKSKGAKQLYVLDGGLDMYTLEIDYSFVSEDSCIDVCTTC